MSNQLLSQELSALIAAHSLPEVVEELRAHVYHLRAVLYSPAEKERDMQLAELHNVLIEAEEKARCLD